MPKGSAASYQESMDVLIATAGTLLRTFPMTHSLSIRIAEMWLSSPTLPLLAVGT